MVILFPIAAFFVALAASLRSIGLGLVAVFAVGYVSGVIRANFLSVHTTFMFDSALLGLYIGFAGARYHELVEVFRRPAGQWVLILLVWPALLTAIPVNDYLVQLVALRATVWFLPVLLIASRMRADDLTVIARGLACLNLVAIAGGVYIYQYGVESLYPQNAITAIIYMSKDVGGAEYYRIPSIFLNAHAYGGAMLFSLPFLIDRAFGRGAGTPDRILATAGIAAALGGILLCAARQPVVLFGIMTVIVWLVARLHFGVGLLTVGLAVIGVLVAGTNERLQRATSLEDTEVVSDRIRVSATSLFLN